METLELKHLAPYLPYKVKSRDYSNTIYRLELSIDNYYRFVGKYADKMVLRPLSYLTKEIEVNGEKFVPIYLIPEYVKEYHSRYGKDRLFDNSANTSCIIDYIKPTSLSYKSFDLLLSWNFDVFFLIPNGLAIDFNTL